MYSCRMHDFDNNTKLDGLEIFKALTHLLPYEDDDDKKVDLRGKSADDIAREKRQKELLFYSGNSFYVMFVQGVRLCTGWAKKTGPLYIFPNI